MQILQPTVEPHRSASQPGLVSGQPTPHCCPQPEDKLCNSTSASCVEDVRKTREVPARLHYCLLYSACVAVICCLCS